MSSEFIDLGGTTPPLEDCAQVGSRNYDYHIRARAEARALMGLLRRTVGQEPAGARLAVKSHPHDFGTYLTVVVYYDPNDPVAAAFAQSCDEQLPEEWDDVARQELHTLNSKGA